MNSQAPNPYEPVPVGYIPGVVTHDVTRIRFTVLGLRLTLGTLFVSGIVLLLIAFDILQIRWNASWPNYWFFVCVPTTLVGWIISIVACVRHPTRLSVVGLIVGFVATLLTTVMFVGIALTGIASHPV